MKVLAYINFALLLALVVAIVMRDDRAIDISSDLFKNALSGYLAVMLND